MYLPKYKGPPKPHPLKIRMAKRHLFAIGNMVFLCTALGAYYLIGVVQDRARPSDAKIDTSRSGKKVIIVGAGAAGCAVASALTSQDGDLNVVVFEPERRSKLQVMMPLAHVGTRSYDLNTNEGHDTLFSPTKWNVVRDAKLVLRSVVDVDPRACTLLDSDGETHSYDYLVIATGSQPDFNAVNGLAPADYNKFRIAQDSFSTRDMLVHLYEGRVIHAKIPPRDPAVLYREAVAQGNKALKPALALKASNNGTPSLSAPWWKKLFGGNSVKELTSGSSNNSQSPILTNAPVDQSLECFEMPPDDAFVGKQHSGTFVSTTNTLWKYLNYFNKDKLCPLTVVSSESTPDDGLPHDYTDVIGEFWKERTITFLPKTLVEKVDPALHTCYLRNSETGERNEIDFKLMLLDLPRCVTGWVARSGLSKPHLGGFANVHPDTLQHREYPNIFAIGDCAAIPTIPSYGAVFTQAPVVAHNVRQLAYGRPITAQYDGYSSFNVIMSTWRHMWPEVSWKSKATPSTTPASTSATLDGATASSQVEQHSRLIRRNEHVWDNSKWRDVRGLLQGVYFQWFGLEVMYWFVFLRYGWYPPNWFQMPVFPEKVDKKPAQRVAIKSEDQKVSA